MKRFVTQTNDLLHCAEGEPFDLPADIAHHVCDVMRLGPGDSLEIADAFNNLVTARIKRDGRVDCQSIQKTAEIQRPYDVTLVVALFKWPRFEWMLEKVTELGVRRIIPVECERSVVKCADWAKKAERLDKIMVEASRQSLNPKKPVLEAPVTFKAFVAQNDVDSLYFAHLGNYPTLASCLPTWHGDVGFLIGPEGGFSPAEVETLLKCASPVSLGQTVLRAETAAITCAATLALV